MEFASKAEMAPVSPATCGIASIIDCAHGDKTNSEAEHACPHLEVMFDRSPLDNASDFVSYCKYLYTCGAMGSELHVSQNIVRQLLRQHAEQIKSLKDSLNNESSGLSIADSEQLTNIEKLQTEVEVMDRTRKRNAYTLRQSPDNESTCRVLTEKLETSQKMLDEKLIELETAKHASVAYVRREATIRALQELYDTIGATKQSAVVDKLKRKSGLGCGSRGSQFEALGLAYVNNVLLGELAVQYGVPVEHLRYSANVTLKIPQVTDTAGEIDGIVFEIDPAEHNSSIASSSGVGGGDGGDIDIVTTDAVSIDTTTRFTVRRVLAVIEMKRNIDDIGPAYESRLRTMRWLAGIESAADTLLRKNKHYPSGRFSEPAIPKYRHHYDKNTKCTYAFTPESFASFAELDLINRGHNMLHFFVRRSPITCVPSAECARIQSALASSTEIDGDTGVDSPLNASSMDALRLKIRSSSRYLSSTTTTSSGTTSTTSTSSYPDLHSKCTDPVSSSPEVISTAYQVVQLCRIHVLLSDNAMKAVDDSI